MIPTTLLNGDNSMTNFRSFLSIPFVFAFTVTFFGGSVFGQLTYDRLSDSQLNTLRKKADSGDVKAQSEVGQRLCYGIGVVRDESDGAEYLEKAAERGDVTAKAVCYDEGLGVARDMKEAVNLYRKAAAIGDSVAQNNLGVCYQNGYGVDKNEREALRWFRKAAEQNLAEANVHMAELYFEGEGVPEDTSKALALLRKGVEQGSDVAQMFLGTQYLLGSIQESDTEAKAIRLLQKAEQNNVVEAQLFLALAYGTGKGVTKDLTQAERRMNRGLKKYHRDIRNEKDAITLVGVEVGLNGMFEDVMERTAKIDLSKCPKEFKSAFLDTIQGLQDFGAINREAEAFANEKDKIIQEVKKAIEKRNSGEAVVGNFLEGFFRGYAGESPANIMADSIKREQTFQDQVNELDKKIRAEENRIFEKGKNIRDHLIESAKKCKRIAREHDVEFTAFDFLKDDSGEGKEK
jgi:TPR repeat protein